MTMYHVLGTGLTATIFYIISWTFCRYGIYTLQFHRKIWNSVLAATFLVTAIAGIFLALQINYKWDIPVIRTILKWHVETGIGLAFTGLFHFIWHLSYFTKIFGKQDASELPHPESSHPVSTDPAVNLFMIGFISSAVQLLLLKELMNISGGYEIISGTFLGTWLIASAAGAALAGKSTLNDLKKINLMFMLSPLVSVFLIILLSRLWLNPGETPSFLVSALLSFLVLFPFCAVSGLTFIKLTTVAGREKSFNPGKSFSIETTGGISAGIAVSLFSSGLLNTYQTILLIIIAGVTYYTLTFSVKGLRGKLLFKVLILIISSAIIIGNPDRFFRQILLHGIKVISSEETPYGNVTRAEYGGEESIYYNQRLLTYFEDVVEREENIHYTMLQSDEPEQILIISGSINSLLPEILKYPVIKTVYVERDPALSKIQKLSLSDQTENLVLENDDAFSYIRTTDERFDAVILLLPPPSSLSLNRFYTLEFFASVKKILNKEGLFSCSPGVNPHYFNEESVSLFSSVHNSLEEVFRYVTPVAGNKLYLIASDKEISTSFGQMAEDKNIVNQYVSHDYLSDDLVKAKSDEVKSLMDKDIRQNKTTIPSACFYYQSFNLSKSLKESTMVIILMVVVFALPFVVVKRKGMLMYFTASALAGFEIIVLLSLQLIMGNMYQVTGLVISGLMAGLAIGAGMKAEFPTYRSTALKITLLFGFYLVAGLTVKWYLALKGGISVIFLMLILSFIPAFITGTLFRDLTVVNRRESHVSGIYSADLAGSALGFILFSGLAIPFLGIERSLYVIAFFIIAGFVAGMGNKQNF